MRLALTLVRGTGFRLQGRSRVGRVGDGAPGAGTARGSDAPIAQGSTAGLCQGVPRQWRRGVQPSTIKVSQNSQEAERCSSAEPTRRKKGQCTVRRFSRALGLVWAIAGSERIKFREDHRCFFFAGEKEGDQRLKGKACEKGAGPHIKHKTTSYSPRSPEAGGRGTRASKSQNRALLRLEIGSRVGLKWSSPRWMACVKKGAFEAIGEEEDTSTNGLQPEWGALARLVLRI